MRISRYVSPKTDVGLVRSHYHSKNMYRTRSCFGYLKLKRDFSKNLAFLKIIILVSFLFPFAIQAQINDVTIADVTTRAFSVVWVSDAPVISANVSLFADAGGTQPVTTATIDVVSSGISGAHDNGIVKIDIAGLDSNTAYHFSIQSTTTLGTDVFPQDSSLLHVATSVETSKVNPLNQPIVNDLINYSAYGLDGLTPAPGTIVLIDIPSVSDYPLSAFVGNNSALNGSAVVDLNNLFDQSGVSASVAGGEVMVIKEIRGLSCVGLQNQSISRFSKSPLQNESPPVTTLEVPDTCYVSDRNCDQTVNILDFQFVLNSFNSTNGECAFNPDADIVADQVINILDAQGVLNDFGQAVP